jgi:hypothetical protein
MSTSNSSTSGPILSIQLTFSLSKRPLIKTNYDCWQQLFKSFYVVEDTNPIVKENNTKRSAKSFGKGLEMSFDLMAALAGVECPVIVEKGVVLVGYHAALIPADIKPNYVQFHLEVNNEGQINPYTISYGARSLTLDYQQFKSLRCFVGWCETAHILLGTSALPIISVRYSSSRRGEEPCIYRAYLPDFRRSLVVLSRQE